jgi:hypothetical protein
VRASALPRFALAALLLASAAARASDDDGWQPLVTQDGVSVRERGAPDRALPELEAEGEIDAGIFEVLAVITDVPNQTKWMPDCVEARFVRQDSPELGVIYNRTAEPWPVSDRDVVLRTEVLLLEPGTHAATRFANVEDAAAPPVDGVVRMPRLAGEYDLVALAPTRTKVTYRLDADPGGSLPAWVTTRFARNTPLQTLLGLRNQVHATRGRYAEFVAQWSARR